MALTLKMTRALDHFALRSAAVKDGVDPFMTEAILVPYDIPNQSVAR